MMMIIIIIIITIIIIIIIIIIYCNWVVTRWQWAADTKKFLIQIAQTGSRDHSTS